ncbi:dynein regulatory complex protein 9 isoform X2 [Carettochelys insculpta]|uniref:dynein regulatory complex protein 9 isoform X2 n=1 Tax=Carettochelys insculpta TaxID=44489 RepID=UPI003EC02E5C
MAVSFLEKRLCLWMHLNSPSCFSSATGIIDAQEISEIIKSQKELGVKFEQLMSARSENRPTVPSDSLKFTELGQQLQETSGDLKRANHLFSRAARQSAVSSDNLRKVQADRQYASDVIAETLQEMQTSGTFQSLVRAVQREEERKSNFHTIIIREEEGRKTIKSLQKRLQDVKKEKELELQNRNEMIAYLKDQLQEMKAKTDMESRYVKKDTELQVSQTQKKCSNAESELFTEIEKLRIKTDEETRVHVEIENFLRQQQMTLEEKLEYWMEKYEKDTEAKQQELNTLKASKANDLAALQELAKQCRLFEQVIVEDRVEKEAARRKVEQEALELKSVRKLQAWWRGTMVRRNLGPYKIIKKPKEDETKGKDKGKKEKDGAKKKK